MSHKTRPTRNRNRARAAVMDDDDDEDEYEGPLDDAFDDDDGMYLRWHTSTNGGPTNASG